MGIASETRATTSKGMIELYEPAMCCSTGVCGPSVDQQLLAIRDDLHWIEEQGASVARHNLASAPDAFVANTKVTALMHALGEAALPVLVVDGEVQVHGRYPTRDELAAAFDDKPTALPTADSSSSGCGCGPGSSC